MYIVLISDCQRCFVGVNFSKKHPLSHPMTASDYFIVASHKKINFYPGSTSLPATDVLCLHGGLSNFGLSFEKAESKSVMFLKY